MSPRLCVASLMCSCVLLTASARPANAGWPRVPAPKRPPVTPYVPRIQEYAVVVPPDPHAVDHEHAPWEQQRPKAPMYPWGWFGARSHWQPSTHLRYYGETVDYGIRRGY